MGRLICSELRKLLKNKIFLLILFVLLTAFYYSAFMNARRINRIDRKAFDEAQKLFDENGGGEGAAALKAAADEVSRQYLSLGDYSEKATEEYTKKAGVYYLAAGEAEYFSGYKKEMADYAVKAVKSKLKAEAAGNKYDGRFYKKLADCYNVDRQISFVNRSSLGQLMDDYHSIGRINTFNIVLVLFCVSVSTLLLQMENDAGMSDFAGLSACGRGRLALAKILTVTLVNFVLCVLLMVTEMFAAGYYGVFDFSAALQSYDRYEYCPYDLSVGAYIVFASFLRFVCMMSCVGIMAGLNVIGRKMIGPMLAGVVVLGVPMYAIQPLVTDEAGKTAQRIELISKLKPVLPLMLLFPDEYTKGFYVAGIAGIPVFRLTVVLAVSAFVLIAGSAAYIYSESKLPGRRKCHG